MHQFVFISGNQHKVDLLIKWLGHSFEHQKVDLDEVQSLEIKVVAEHKARQAYDLVKKPVLVEDVSLMFDAMGRLPGTMIKWFLEELSPEGLAKLACSLEHQKARAVIVYALFDGKHMEFFEHTVHGHIASEPRSNGQFVFGWNEIFVPEGSEKTYAEMNEEELKQFSHRAPAVAKLRRYLDDIK